MASLPFLRSVAAVAGVLIVVGVVPPAAAASPTPSPSPSAEPATTPSATPAASASPGPVPSVASSPLPAPAPVSLDAPAESVVVPAVGEPLRGIDIPDPEAEFVGVAQAVDLPEAGVELLTVAPEASATDAVTPVQAVDAGVSLAEPVWSELVATAFEGEPWAEQLNTGRPDLEVSKVAEALEGEKVLAETIPAEVSKFLPGAVLAWELSAVTPDQGSAWAAMTVDYEAIGEAFGGDYGQRLELMAFPACALTTPSVPACVTGVALETTHHEDDTTMSAVVPLESLEPLGGSGLAAPMDGTVGGGSIIAAVSGASGSTGTFTQTPSVPDGTWGVSEQSGSFTYSVPFEVPQTSAGASPDVSVTYSSASVDGRTVSTNSQPSWVGEGWDLQMPYIERLYKSCAKNSFTSRGSELCWHSPYSTDVGNAAYVMYFNGTTQELVWDGADRYRLANDDGTRVTLKTGASNGDNNGEYFWVQTPDGSVYQFGRGVEPQLNITTNSVATAPVYGNNTGEPRCGSAATDYCVQGYRWMLDIAFDANENATLYRYAKETNKYAAGSSPSSSVSYTSAIYPSEIDYGYQWGDTSTTFESRLMFYTKARCVELSGSTYDPFTSSATCPNTYNSNATSYPDVPLDLMCTATCTSAQNSPVFFMRQRLDSIRADVYTTTWVPERRRQFHYTFPANSDGSAKALWLEDIVDVDYGDPAVSTDTMYNYAINFDGVELANRVDWAAGSGRIFHRRIAGIRTDTGAYVDVNYATDNAKHCPIGGTTASGWAGWHDPLAAAGWENNTWECSPSQFDPDGSGSQPLQWGLFHRYTVRSIAVIDRAGASPTTTTTYSYIGSPAWGYQNSILFELGAGSQTWNAWRGYETVQSTTGSGKNKVMVRNQYFRGLHDDYRSAGSAANVSLTPWSYGSYPTGATRTAVTDLSYLQGKLLTSTTFDADNVLQASTRYVYDPDVRINGPSVHNSVDAHVSYSTDYARVVAPVGGAVTFRTTQVKNAYDALGRVTEQVTTASDAATTLRSCVQTEYASYVEAGGVEQTITSDAGWGGRHYFSVPRRISTRDMTATTVCANGDRTSRTDIYYDGETVFTDQNVVDGNATQEKTWSDTSHASLSAASYDTYGRMVKAWLPSQVGNATASMTWAYTRAPSGVQEVTTTNALNQVSKTWTEPVHGNVTKSQSTNGLYTHYLYDAMGRLVRGWSATDYGASAQPSPTSDATVAYTYAATADGLESAPYAPIKFVEWAHKAATTTVQGQNVATVSYSDTLGRTVQVHTRSHDAALPGTNVVLTEYDSSGNVSATSAGLYAAPVSGATPFVDYVCSQQESCTVTENDFVGRPLTQKLVNNGVAKYTTTYKYLGGSTQVDGPTGGISETVTDVAGRTTAVNIHAGSTINAATALTTTYAYNVASDGLKSVAVTDPEGNATTTTTDWLGRTVSLADPNSGTVSYTYDSDSQVTRVDSAAGSVSSTYDPLGRVTQRITSTLASPSAAESTTTYTYDEADGVAIPGQLIKTQHTTGDPSRVFTSTISARDAKFRPTQTTIRLPDIAALGAFRNGTYSTAVTYDALGRVNSTTLPAVGPETSDTVTATLDKFGQTTALSSSVNGSILNSVTRMYDGRITNRAMAIGGVVRTITWDNTTRAPLTLNASAGATTYQQDTYTYDPQSGRVNGIVDAVTGIRQCYTYDAYNRLSAAWTQSGTTGSSACASTVPTNTTWNVAQAESSYKNSWTYSASGRIMSAVAATADNTNAATTTYSYADSSHPHAATSTTGANAGTFTYDTAGRMITRTVDSTQNLTWDVLSNLSSVTADGVTTEHLYDGSGQRFASIVGTKATIYMGAWEATDPTTDTTEATDVTVTRLYTAGGVQLASKTSGAGMVMSLGDVQGSAQVAVSSTGEVTRNAYTPFGVKRAGSTVASAHGWLNQVADADTGLTYLNARYNDPVLGRFLSPDPLLNPADPRTLDPYRYADNNPVAYTDATGLSPSCPAFSGHAADDRAVTTCYQRYADHANPVWALQREKDQSNYHIRVDKKKAAIALAGLAAGIGCGFASAGTAAVACAVGTSAAISTLAYGLYTPQDQWTASGYTASALKGAAVGLVGWGFGAGASAAIKGVVSALARTKSASTTLVASGGAANSVDDGLVLARGGTNTPDRFVNGSGVTVDEAGRLSGVSVNSGPTIQDAARGVPHNQIGVTTAGDVRAAGGTVTLDPTPGNPGHCLLSGCSADTLSQLFRPTIPNPAS